jgi:hypothetical protein
MPSNVDNLNRVRREFSGYFRNNWKEYLKAKLRNFIIRYLYRGVNDFKKRYQSRTNILKNGIPAIFWLVGGTNSPAI